MVIYAVKNMIKMTEGYLEYLDVKLSFKQRLVVAAVNVVLALIFMEAILPVKILFSAAGIEFKMFLVALVAFMSLIKPATTLSMLIVLYISAYVASKLFPLR